jgi:putative transposase
MSRKYKFKDSTKPYFVSFATVYWLDVFTREEYKQIWVDSVKYCQQNKGLEVYAYCLMTNHAHMIISSETAKLSDIMRDMKKYTAEKIISAIKENISESRKEWLIKLFEQAAKVNSNNTRHQFWQQDNHPIELSTNEMLQQKLDYIHLNPVKAGFVSEPHHWKYSSALDYSGGKGILDILIIE